MELTRKQMALLDTGENVVLAYRPLEAKVDGATWQVPTLVCTDRRIIVTKDKLIGKPRAEYEAPFASVSEVRGEPWWGGSAGTILLTVEASVGAIALVVKPEDAVDV